MGSRHCEVWGVLNVTSDSFSDGGRFIEVEAALKQAQLMLNQGADVIDVGGESTRPGAERVSPEEEMRRVLPVIEALAAEGVRVSIDTMRSEVAKAAVELGAEIVNDVSGGLADPLMHSSVAELGCSYVLMHWRAHSREMDQHSDYADVVAEVSEELAQQCRAAISAGIAAEKLMIDPGLGFSKQPEHNWSLLRHLDRFVDTGYPVLVGASRKRFLAPLAPAAAPPEARDAATAAISLYAALNGAAAVRVHEVSGTFAAIKVAGEIWQAT